MRKFENITGLIEATALKAARTLDYPEMLAQRATIQVHVELLRPELEQSIQTIHAAIGIAIMPAIDQAQRLRMPVPVPSRMHLRIHGPLHRIQISDLVEQRLIIDAADMRIERAEQHGCFGIDRVYRLLA